MVKFSTHYRAMQASEGRAYADKQDYIVVRNGNDYGVVARADYKLETHGYLHSISMYIGGAIITLHVRHD